MTREASVAGLRMASQPSRVIWAKVPHVARGAKGGLVE
jgi:hypothetical protein